MEVEFDFREEQSRIFGLIKRPVAEITFVYNGKEILESVYIDSGADISLIPKSVGDALGFEIEKTDKVVEIKGIGDRGVPIIVKRLEIKVGERLVDTRVAWSLIEEVPMLLGRVDIFKLFNICFKKKRRVSFQIN